MSGKDKIVFEGEQWYAVPLVAKLLGTSATKVRKLIEPEGLEWRNFRVNGPIYISAVSLSAYQQRLKTKSPEV